MVSQDKPNMSFLDGLDVRRAVMAVTTCIVMMSAVSLRGQEGRFQIADGTGHGVLLKSDGSVWTWGGNGAGQLGRDDDDSWAPAQVPGLSDIRSVAAGDEFTMALKMDGTVWMWGQNQDGQLGNGSTNDSKRPAAVSGLPRIVAIAAGGKHAMALDSNGTVWGWGSVPNRSSLLIPQRVPNLANVLTIAAGDDHSIALDSNGQVWVWGDHGAGQLADHCFISYYPQKTPLSDITAVAGGYQLTVGLKKDGTVWSIGYGAAGQHGDGSTESSTKPVMVSGLSGVKAIAARYMSVLALKGDGTLWGWGANHVRQLGNPAFSAKDSSKPVRVGALSGVMAIAVAGSHAAAVTGQGVVWTWGQNDRGAMGADPEALEQSDAPMQPGQEIPPACRALFACLTAGGKMIRICGEQNPDDIEKWSSIHYRFGPVSGPPDFMFPEDPDNATASLFYSRENRKRDRIDLVRFSNGAYTYRVYYGSELGGGVEVSDAKGKRLSGIACAERPEVYSDYLRMNLPCDPKNPVGCK
jgi:alpha-tubulin suppressor-like RCC1 family protein